MSNQPKDSQPPEDNNALNTVDDDDFWDLDSSEMEDFALPDEPEASTDNIGTFTDLAEDDLEPEIQAKEVAPKSETPAVSETPTVQEPDENKDFWDLNNQYDQIDLEQETAETTETEEKPLIGESVAKLDTPDTESESETKNESAIETKPKTDTPATAKISSSTLISSPAAANSVEKIVAPKKEKPTPTNTDQKITSPDEPNTENYKDRRTPFELLCSMICYLGIIAVFAYLVHYASKQHDFNTEPSYATNVPVSGEYASIANIETWWEKPKQGKAKYGVILVPVAKITLGSDAKSGSIRSFFLSPANELINQEAKRKGDSITLEFRDGKFLETGTNEITIHATDGYEEEAHYNYYRSQDEERWTIEIRETSSQSSDFKYLAKAPIEPILK